MPPHSTATNPFLAGAWSSFISAVSSSASYASTPLQARARRRVPTGFTYGVRGTMSGVMEEYKESTDTRRWSMTFSHLIDDRLF